MKERDDRVKTSVGELHFHTTCVEIRLEIRLQGSLGGLVH